MLLSNSPARSATGLPNPVAVPPCCVNVDTSLSIDTTTTLICALDNSAATSTSRLLAGTVNKRDRATALMRPLNRKQNGRAFAQTHNRNVQQLVDAYGLAQELKMRTAVNQHQTVMLVMEFLKVQEAAGFFVNADVNDFVAERLLDDLAVFFQNF